MPSREHTLDCAKQRGRAYACTCEAPVIKKRERVKREKLADLAPKLAEQIRILLTFEEAERWPYVRLVLAEFDAIQKGDQLCPPNT